MSERQGIEIDYCPTCRGIRLDRGELDKMLERASAEMAPAMPEPSRAPQPPIAPKAPHPPQAPYPPQGGYDPRYDQGLTATAAARTTSAGNPGWRRFSTRAAAPPVPSP